MYFCHTKSLKLSMEFKLQHISNQAIYFSKIQQPYVASGQKRWKSQL